jgi:uracil-DNA glycosylase
MSESKQPQVHASWLAHLKDEFEKEYMTRLKQFIMEEKKTHDVYPPGPLIFNALNTTPLDQVKVVILGQDPYHGNGQAHGLSFSVLKGIKPPPSLRNMFKELHESLGIIQPDHGELTEWAQQGVLLLNTTLTVRASTPKSHAGHGWEEFTGRVIDVLNTQRDGLAFMLWGSHAMTKQEQIDARRHLILTAPHPSPFSAHKGFFGCAHFAKANEHLRARNEPEINWQLT